ncbi:MAG: hypothetical protein RLZZ511_1576 [Cyanobacteriota bacterium]|jgi:broad specificity phosphatase PhoE
MSEFLQILLIRHAQSTGNVERRMQGHGDYPLSDRGRWQGERLADRLRAENWMPTAIYSSPLRRAQETTAILMQAFPALSLPIQSAPELAEYRNGILQGLTWAEARQQYPELCDRLETELDWLPVPGAETLLEARDRVDRFLQRLFATHQNGDRLWLISHSWIMQQLVSALLGSDRAWGFAVANTALFEFRIDQSRWQNQGENRLNTDLWRIVRFNDAAHLYDASCDASALSER